MNRGERCPKRRPPLETCVLMLNRFAKTSPDVPTLATVFQPEM